MKSQLLPLPLSSRRSILLPILSALLLLLVWSPPQTVEARVGNSDSNWNSNSNSNSNWNVRAENAIGSSRPAHPQGQTSPAAKADATTAADSRMEFGFARVLEQSVLSIRHQSRGSGIGRSNSNSNSSNDKMNKNDKTGNNKNKTSKNNNNKSDARRRLAQKWARDEDGKILWWIWVVIGCSIALCCLFCCCTSVCCLRD